MQQNSACAGKNRIHTYFTTLCACFQLNFTDSRRFQRGTPPSVPTPRTKKAAPKGRLSDCRKTYITKRVVRPTPINPQKAATCAWLFALLKGGAPRWSGGRTAILSLVRCPDGHTFFAFLRTTGPARERSMGAAARRQRGSAVWERRHSASPLQKLEKVA